MTKITHLKHGDRLRVTGIVGIADDTTMPLYATLTGRLYIVGAAGCKHYLDECLGDDGATLSGITKAPDDR